MADIVPGRPDQALLRRPGEGQEIAVDVQKKAGGIPGGAVEVPSVCLGEVQSLLRPCQRHKRQPPLLLHGLLRPHLPGGEDPLIHAAEEHIGKFQALGGVNGHQPHLVSLLRRVGIGEQSHMGQIVLQGDLLPAGGLVLIYRLLQLRQIVQPFLAALGAEHLLVAALIEEGRKHLGHRSPPISGGKGLYQADKPSGACSFEKWVLQIVLQRLIQGAALPLCVLLQKCHPPLPKIPLGDVDDPPEGKVVLVGNHPQVREGVLDFHTVKELDAAVNRIGDLLSQQDFLHRPGHIVGPVEHRHVPVWRARLVKLLHLPRYPFGLRLLGLREVADDRTAGGQRGLQFLFDTSPVLVDQGIRGRENLRRRAVVLHH